MGRKALCKAFVHLDDVEFTMYVRPPPSPHPSQTHSQVDCRAVSHWISSSSGQVLTQRKSPILDQYVLPTTTTILQAQNISTGIISAVFMTSKDQYFKTASTNLHRPIVNHSYHTTGTILYTGIVSILTLSCP